MGTETARSPKLKLVAVLLAAAGAAVVIILAINMKGTKEPPAVSPPDLARHPVYSTYVFSDSDDVIDIGIQPMYAGPGLITEAMRRDVQLKKALADRGQTIRFHSFLKGVDSNFFLERGDLEVGVGGDMPALSAVAKSRVVVASTIQHGFSAIVARRPMLVKELRGKRVAYPLGSSAHYALLHTLRSAGLTEADVRMVRMDIDEMPDALGKGEIDAFAAWEPIPTIAAAKYPDVAVIHRSLTSAYLYFRRAFAQRHPEAVRQIVASEMRALRWMHLHQRNFLRVSRWAISAGEALSGREAILLPEEYARLTRDDLPGLVSAVEISPRYLADGGPLFREFKFLQRTGRISENVSWDDVRSCFDESIVDEILSSGNDYNLMEYQYGDEAYAQHEPR